MHVKIKTLVIGVVCEVFCVLESFLLFVFIIFTLTRRCSITFLSIQSKRNVNGGWERQISLSYMDQSKIPGEFHFRIHSEWLFSEYRIDTNELKTTSDFGNS